MMNLDEAWDCIDSANLIADTRDRKCAIENAIVHLRRLIGIGDIRAWYPIGYAYYCHPDRQVFGSQQASEMTKCFSTSIQLNVEASLCRLYLAYHFYDIRDLIQSEHHLGLVRSQDMDDTMQMRYKELRLCVNISRNGIEESINDISSYVDDIKALYEYVIPPLNLMNVVETEVNSRPLSSRSIDALRKLDSAFPVLGKSWFTQLASGAGGKS